MGDLVDHRGCDDADKVGLVTRQAGDRTAKDGDAIGHGAPVGQRRAPGQFNALIKTEQGPSASVQLFGGGPVGDGDDDVLHPATEGFGNAVEGIGYELLELSLTELNDHGYGAPGPKETKA